MKDMEDHQQMSDYLTSFVELWHAISNDYLVMDTNFKKNIPLLSCHVHEFWWASNWWTTCSSLSWSAMSNTIFTQHYGISTRIYYISYLCVSPLFIKTEIYLENLNSPTRYLLLYYKYNFWKQLVDNLFSYSTF